MKRTLFIISIAALTGCNSNSSIKDYIPGIYVSQELGTSEFSTLLSDTVYIEPIGNDGNNYIITRNVHYQRKVNGITQSVEGSSEKETGTFNKDNGTIFTTKDGRTISFDPLHKQIMIQMVVYKRIK